MLLYSDDPQLSVFSLAIVILHQHLKFCTIGTLCLKKIEFDCESSEICTRCLVSEIFPLWILGFGVLTIELLGTVHRTVKMNILLKLQIKFLCSLIRVF